MKYSQKIITQEYAQKNVRNIVDKMDMYFIFIFHFGAYSIFSFQIHTNHWMCIKVRNTS